MPRICPLRFVNTTFKIAPLLSLAGESEPQINSHFGTGFCLLGVSPYHILVFVGTVTFPLFSLACVLTICTLVAKFK